MSKLSIISILIGLVLATLIGIFLTTHKQTTSSQPTTMGTTGSDCNTSELASEFCMKQVILDSLAEGETGTGYVIIDVLKDTVPVERYARVKSSTVGQAIGPLSKNSIVITEKDFSADGNSVEFQFKGPRVQVQQSFSYPKHDFKNSERVSVDTTESIEIVGGIYTLYKTDDLGWHRNN